MTDALFLLASFVLYGVAVYMFGLERGRHDRGTVEPVEIWDYDE